jgi:hypothetical protein
LFATSYSTLEIREVLFLGAARLGKLGWSIGLRME